MTDLEGKEIDTILEWKITDVKAMQLLLKLGIISYLFSKYDIDNVKIRNKMSKVEEDMLNKLEYIFRNELKII
jgi:hypothetical protein